MAHVLDGRHLYDNSSFGTAPTTFTPKDTNILTHFYKIKYTLGEVMASLAMIESPTNTALIEPKSAPPPYADEPNAPVEKEPLMPSEAEADADVEVTITPNKPITHNIRTTMRHLKNVGGFRGRWRGLGWSIFYHMAHGFASNLLAAFMGLGVFGSSLTYIMVSICLSRLHMAWTHSMIAAPTNTPWYTRMVPRKQCKPLLLPALVFATAQQATIILPIAVAFALGLPQIHAENIHDKSGCHMGLVALRFLAVPATFLIVALAVLLPAAVTLTRIEALLLPTDRETIVPFDRAAILGDIDMTKCGSSKSLFVSAWRSFDRAARLRLIKLYVKMALVQVAIVVVAVHLLVAESFLINGEKLAQMARAAHANVTKGVVAVKEGAQ